MKGDNMDIKTLLGKNIKYYRCKKGYHQEQLAELLNVNPNYIDDLERGKHNPSIDLIAQLSEILNIEPSCLFKQNEKENEE